MVERIDDYRPQYLRDFGAMLEPELQKCKVRSGNPDPKRIYEVLFGKPKYDSLYELGAAKINYVINQMSTMQKDESGKLDSELHSCQIDLLRLEFGVNETTADKLMSINDYFETTPLDAMEIKLHETLSLIVKSSVPTDDFWKDSGAMVYYGAINCQRLAQEYQRRDVVKRPDLPERIREILVDCQQYQSMRPWEQALLSMEYGTHEIRLGDFINMIDRDRYIVQTPVEILKTTMDAVLSRIYYLTC